MIIKKLASMDSNEVFELEKSCFPQSFWTLDQIHSHFQLHSGISIFIKKNLGYILYLENSDQIEILRLGVLPEERKKGLANFMISNLEELKKDILLEVSSLNIPALQLYNKCNFQKIHERKKYYPDGSSAIIFKKNVTNIMVL